MSKEKTNKVQKLVSVFILWCMVAGGLLGLLTTQVGSGADPVQPAPMFVPAVINSLVVVRDSIYNADYGITVNVGGTLWLVNSTLNFPQDDSTDQYLHVNGGSLIMENSTITTGATPVAAWDPFFEMELTNGWFEMTRNSVLAFPGWLNVTNTVTYINDSWITSLEPMLFYDAWADSFPSFRNAVSPWWLYTPRDLTKAQDDAPVMQFVNCPRASIADSRVDELYENDVMIPSLVSFSDYFYPSAAITTPFTPGDVNSLIDVDQNYMRVSSGVSRQVLDITDFDTQTYTDDLYVVLSVRIQAVYNTSESGTGGYDNNDNLMWGLDGGTLSPAFQLQAQQPYPPGATTVSGQLSPTPTISEMANLNLQFNNTETVDGDAAVLFDQIRLIVELRPRFIPTTTILLDNTDMAVINSYVAVDWTSATSNFHSKNAFELVNGANLYMYGMTISEDEGGVDGIRDYLEIPVGATNMLNYMPVRVGADGGGSEAYYYKWLDSQVFDKYGLAVPGATVTPEFYHPDPNVVAFVANYNDLSTTTDPAKARIMEYLNRVHGVTPATYDQTGLDGRAMLPLLTTFLNSTNYPNGAHAGEYDVEANYAAHFGYGVCDFMPFPNILTQNNMVAREISLDGLTLPRSFGDSGLIVNATTGDVSRNGGISETLTINDFIIVENNAVLTVSNAKLQMAYSGAAPFEIIVRDGGRLVLNNVVLSTLDSYPITIRLMNNANLTMIDSSASAAMTIIAYDSATVVLNRATISGVFSTGNNANVRLWATSTQFASSISSFTGTSIARLIGCHSPSATFRIMPSEQAKVYVYRWAEITVHGGLTPANPLQGANVMITSAHTEWGSLLNRQGTTNVTGVYRESVLSDYIYYDQASSSVVSSSYNLYTVAVQYQYHITTLNHQASLGLGLATYPVMTSQEAIAKKTVVLANVLPDLSPVLAVAPMALNNTVGRGTEVQVTAIVTNIGDATASGLVIWFQDEYQGTIKTIYQEVKQSLAPLQQWNVTFPYAWVNADEIGAHNIMVWIDPMNSIKEQNNDNNQDTFALSVISQADLAILSYGDVWFSESNPLVDREFTINANIRNLGDLDITDVLVSFYELNSGSLLGNYTIDSISMNTMEVASIPVTFTVNDTYYILVIIDPLDDISEVNENNNNNSAFPRQLIVREFPGLEIIAFVVIEGTNLANIGLGLGTPVTETYNRTMVTLRARVENQGELFASGVRVEFFNGATSLGFSNTIPSITSGSSAYAMLTWEAVTPLRQQTFTLRAVARDSSLGLTSNDAATSLTVYDDRPDLELINIELANNATQVIDGNTFLVNVTITNNGIGNAAEFAVEIYASQENYETTRLAHASGNQVFTGRLSHTDVQFLAAGDTITLTMGCTSITEGAREIFIFVDPEFNNTDTIDYDGMTPIHGDVEEYDERNNNGTYIVTVIMPELRILLQVPAIGNNVFVEGEVQNILITGLVVRANNPSIGVPGINVTIVVGNRAPIIVMSLAGGFFSTNIDVTTMSAGNYTIRASGTDINEVQSWFRIDTPDSTPWWIIIVIILIVVAVIVGITLYLYFVGLGKTVQCGDCGAFIPEGAAKCPKCGVEFETEVAKCSVCGAWVPIDVKNCPDCGTEFTVGTEDLDDYESKMKRQFEDIVRKFREQAKQDLGKEFTETEFQAWWAKQPTFITFDLWLKEEEEMKRMGSRPCPICETENSVTAKICHKCGSVMGEPEAPAPKKPEGKLPPKQEQPPVKQQPAPTTAAPQKQPPVQPAPAQQPPVQQQAAAPQPVAQAPAQQPAPAQPGKKGCPSCGMEVNATDKVCPICSFEFQDAAGGDAARRIIRKPIKKIVRRPGEPGGEGGQ